MEVIYNMIDTDTSYNMLLGRLWIHLNLIVPSILYQCMKYVDEEGNIKILVAEKQSFKGLKTILQMLFSTKTLLKLWRSQPQVSQI